MRHEQPDSDHLIAPPADSILSLDVPGGRERMQHAFDNSLRVTGVLDLATLVGSDAFESRVDGDIEDFFDFLSGEYDAHESLAPLRKLFAKSEEDPEVFGELLTHHSALGFAVRFTTPVMTKTGRRSWSFSWGYTQSTWAYADSYGAAFQLGIAWAKKCRAASKSVPKRAPKRKDA